jgi:sugar/nucleoside kinase (ribokinase family)
MQLDVLTVGNALIDAFLTIKDADEKITLDRQTRTFRIGAGEKIQLDNCVFEVGGNACNVGVGLARFGFTTGLMAEIGEDEFSDTIISRLEKEHVVTTHVKRSGQSSFAIGINFQGERTLFVQHVEREHIFSFHPVVTHAIYLTSIGRKWHHVYQQVRDFVKKHDTFLALNPGTKQLQDAPGFIRDLLPYSQVLFINREEGLRLIGQETGHADTKHLLTALVSLGAQTVVVTDGNKGSYVVDPFGKMYHAPIYDAPIIERTGAGDGYSTGFLAALLFGKGVTEAMRWGSFNAAGVIGKVGAQPGLLTAKEMETYLEDEKAVPVTEL